MGKLLLLLGIPIALVALVILILLNHQTTKSNQNDGSKSTQSAGKNPMIDQTEINRVQNGNRVPNSSVQPSSAPAYHFNYQLAPSLKEKQSYLPHISVANASDCGLGLMPSHVTAYALAMHITATSAKKTAADYALSGDPSSIMMEDGISFKYFFSDTVVSAFIEIIEPSGMYKYHKAIKDNPAAPVVDLAKAEANANTLLTAHMLTDATKLINANFDSGSSTYTISYQKDYSGLKLVDAAQVKFLTETKPICDIKTTDAEGTITVLENNKGDITNVINNTRQVLETHDFPREKIDDALVEYGDTPIMPPITFGTTKVSGKVTITAAQLVMFDYGNTYGQKMYVPVYLTSGTLAGGGTVITLFPAVAGSELAKAPAFVEKSGSHSIKLATFNLPPKLKPAAPGGACFGGLVDYNVQCSLDGSPICTGMVSLPSSSDPLGACSQGCQTKTGAITIDASDIKSGESGNACNIFMKQQGINDDLRYMTGGSGISPRPQDKMTCTLSACPC